MTHTLVVKCPRPGKRKVTDVGSYLWELICIYECLFHRGFTRDRKRALFMHRKIPTRVTNSEMRDGKTRCVMQGPAARAGSP